MIHIKIIVMSKEIIQKFLFYYISNKKRKIYQLKNSQLNQINQPKT